MGGESIAEFLAVYLRTAELWDALQGDAESANKAFDENHQAYKVLRQSPAGRAAITRLMTHPNIGVRLLAATHSLANAPDEAIGVLESIEAEGGLHAVSAKYTLRSYRLGTLELDW